MIRQNVTLFKKRSTTFFKKLDKVPRSIHVRQHPPVERDQLAGRLVSSFATPPETEVHNGIGQAASARLTRLLESEADPCGVPLDSRAPALRDL